MRITIFLVVQEFDASKANALGCNAPVCSPLQGFRARVLGNPRFDLIFIYYFPGGVRSPQSSKIPGDRRIKHTWYVVYTVHCMYL